MTLESLLRKLIASISRGSDKDESAFEDVPSQYQQTWTEAKKLVNDVNEISQYHPSQLSADDWREATKQLEKFIEEETCSQPGTTENQSTYPISRDLITTTEQKEGISKFSESGSIKNKSGSDSEDIPNKPNVPSRYREVWTEAEKLVDDVYEISQYHPSQLSAGDWMEAVEELEGFIDKASTKAIQNQSIINSRLSEVIKDAGNEEGTRRYQSISNTDEWLNIWARWHSLSSPPTVKPEDQSMTVLTGIGESTAAVLKQSGYTTLREISNVPEDELLQVEGIGEQRAKSIPRQVVYRPVEEIPGIGETIRERLNSICVMTAADLTALSIEDLTDVEGIGPKRAETLQNRAGIWLPSFNEPPDPIRSRFSPPYDSLKEANENLDEFEKALRKYDQLSVIVESLTNSPLKTPDQQILVDVLFDKEAGRADKTESEKGPTWTDVLTELRSFAEGYEQPSLHESIRKRFDIEALPTVKIDVKNVLDEDNPSTAIGQIQAAEKILNEQARFAALADMGSGVVDMAQASPIDNTDALAETITIQLTQAYEQLVAPEEIECLELLEKSLDTSEQTIDLAESYPNYPFEEAIADLTEVDDILSASRERLNTHRDILSVSNDALSMLETVDYDHPAIDQINWQESIKEALKNQYPTILNPIEEQLSRIEDGLWEMQDLSAFDWREFESLIGDLYRDEEYEVTVTQSGADMGVDVWAKNNDTQIAIQVKHFQAGDTVGREPLQKLASTLSKGDADQAVVVTSSDFAGTAKRYADDFGPDLRLIGQEELLRRLSESTIPPSNQ